MRKKNRLGLALSGGGYRAAIYHIGTLRALRKLKILDTIDVISTNSGGSITGACYSINHENFDHFESVLIAGVQKSVIGRVLKNPRFIIPLLIFIGIIIISIYLLFTNFAWLNIIIWPSFLILILLAQFEILPISKIIESIYDDLFFQKKTLKNLSKKFKTTINSTNLATGKIFQFSLEKMGDSKYEYRGELESITFKPERFPISRAVMASSCVPFAFTPVKISKHFYKNPKHFKEVKPRLVDGGVYDNQGIHKLTFQSSSSYCENVIVSDAGTELPFKESFRNVITLLIRTSNVFMARIKNFQMMRNLYRIPLKGESNVAYQSLGFDLEDSMKEFINMLKKGYLSNDVINGHSIPLEWIRNGKWEEIKEYISKKIDLKNLISQGCTNVELKIARSVGTNLVPLKQNQAKALIKHSEIITELQIKLYLPHILN
ncbi:patatin-like phospholipase family protein [Pseudotenacibaculum haliotis]|uniref:Patatin-like phospholipase family protein n=1 Tax=Pseudotenacibaculum haliotis TaxID=1862138 RepID=A0ABW5LVX5_9FLAO